MEREIKFRAWDKKNKRMSEPFTFKDIVEPLGMMGKYVCDIVGKDNKRIYFNLEDCLFIQFTGLKDKNGKEIYEGDIVILDYQKKGVWKSTQGEITFEAGAFILGSNDLEDSYIPLLNESNSDMFCENIKVIGNKFENPELLGKPIMQER